MFTLGSLKAEIPISVNWTFFASCCGWGATGENRSISLQRGQFDPKFQIKRGRPTPIILARIVRPMNALQLCRWHFSHKENFVADFLQAKCGFTRKTAVVRFGSPPTSHSSQKTRLNDLSYGVTIWTDLSSVLSQSMCLTDGHTDRILLARPRLHSTQRGKNIHRPNWPILSCKIQS